jgi:kynurenine formamidase
VWAGGRPLAAEQLSDIEQLHHITASARVYNLEGLVNLHQLPAAGAYLFVGAPPLEDGSGVTVRALALVPRR